MHNEWQDDYRIYGCAMQLDIIEGQIWIQHNSTEIYIDRELIKRGVSPKDIILGFRSPSVRKLLAAAHSFKNYPQVDVKYEPSIYRRKNFRQNRLHSNISREG
jgi:hypothetical protein